MTKCEGDILCSIENGTTGRIPSPAVLGVFAAVALLLLGPLPHLFDGQPATQLAGVIPLVALHNPTGVASRTKSVS